MRRLVEAAVLSAAILSPAVAQEATISPDVARAAFIDPDGNSIGTATIQETPHGLLIQGKVANLPAGPHGFHVHETGTCDAEGGFQSAGGHYAPGDNDHGFMIDEGPHSGDMANQTVGGEGTMVFEVFNENLRLTEGDAAVLDDDGSAIVIHATADDYRSQPSGNSGDRIACAVIEQR
ncbi:MAG: superoxide dismutase family protein [Alphaproteobacteria bacterium]|nr:superoxide dismutase family protein [Alphaproteobacteria bacterium]MBU1552840.1 superoxide dismutase family protein [Alphaproteobacteria bacterium]MBU2334622.1 superoxide dismutase family protein [Alphaproteobacteria bacterium]MBU2388410.1 superoxide dismutase family protein [Alphaproteobacteria bacterium]